MPSNLKNTEKKKIYLHQSITLTGLSTPTFHAAVDQCKNIYEAMKSCFPPGKLNKWGPSRYEGHDALDANARYFTARKFAPDEQSLLFSLGVDTNGILANIRGMDLIHGADNKVAYLRVNEGPDRKIK